MIPYRNLIRQAQASADQVRFGSATGVLEGVVAIRVSTMANTIRVLSTLALMGAVRSLAGKYETVTGTRIDADFAPTLGLLDRLRNGEAADVLILTQEGLAGLAAKGSVASDSCVDLARSFVGLAVTAGAARPDITTEEALRATLLDARSIAYSRLGASGIFFAQLIARLGIASEINTRATIVPQGFTAERLISGEADLAVQQISELKQVAGIDIVGLIPLHLQSSAVFSAGRTVVSKKVEQSERLLNFLASREAAPALRESGLEPFS